MHFNNHENDVTEDTVRDDVKTLDTDCLLSQHKNILSPTSLLQNILS